MRTASVIKFILSIAAGAVTTMGCVPKKVSQGSAVNSSVVGETVETAGIFAGHVNVSGINATMFTSYAALPTLIPENDFLAYEKMADPEPKGRGFVNETDNPYKYRHVFLSRITFEADSKADQPRLEQMGLTKLAGVAVLREDYHDGGQRRHEIHSALAVHALSALGGAFKFNMLIHFSAAVGSPSSVRIDSVKLSVGGSNIAVSQHLNGLYARSYNRPDARAEIYAKPFSTIANAFVDKDSKDARVQQAVKVFENVRRPEDVGVIFKAYAEKGASEFVAKVASIVGPSGASSSTDLEKLISLKKDIQNLPILFQEEFLQYELRAILGDKAIMETIQNLLKNNVAPDSGSLALVRGHLSKLRKR